MPASQVTLLDKAQTVAEKQSKLKAVGIYCSWLEGASRILAINNTTMYFVGRGGKLYITVVPHR